MQNRLALIGIALLLLAYSGWSDTSTNDTPMTNTASIMDDTPISNSAPVMIDIATNKMAVKIKHAHDMISSNVIDSAMWMDSFFGTRRFNRDYTGTRLTLSIGLDWDENGGFSERFGLNGKIALPLASDKFQLVFESINHRGTTANQPYQEYDNEDVDHGAGLRYNFFKKHNIDGHITTGAKLSWGIYPYVKGVVSKQFLQDPWNGVFSQSAYWYTEKGVGTTSEFDLDRSVGRTSLLRSTTDATWSEDSQGIDFGQGLYFMYGESAKNNTHGFILELAMAGHTEPHTVMDRYRLEFKYRRRVIWDWLFLELSPAIEFPRSHDFDLVPKCSLGCDIVFGGTDDED